MDELKKLAAETAVEEIKSGMIVGLGTGSTFHYALLKLAEKIKSGELENIICVASSKRTEHEALILSIPILPLNEIVAKYPGQKIIDIYIDGADEVAFSATEPRSRGEINSDHLEPRSRGEASQDKPDARLRGEVTEGHPKRSEGSKRIDVIKGGGGAMLREKIVAQNSKRFLCVVDESKISDALGTKWPVPMEIFNFALNSELRFMESIGGRAEVRKNSEGCEIFSDSGNPIVDVNFGQMADPAEINAILNERAGIAGHGIFIGYVDRVICATRGGVVTY